MMEFTLEGLRVFVTGAAGLLGRRHCLACLNAGAQVIAIDTDRVGLMQLTSECNSAQLSVCQLDITSETDVTHALDGYLSDSTYKLGLVNNAAINPMVESIESNFTRLEDFSIDQWNRELEVGLTGALIMTKVVGPVMADRLSGVIVNVSSDHGIIAPDQGLYGGPDSDSVKPVTYSVIKHGLIGLTRYTATYWAHRGVRVNTLCPGGVWNGQPNEFLDRFKLRVPMGRMANSEEYMGSLVYLLSDASSYMTGSTVVVDGGRSVW